MDTKAAVVTGLIILGMVAAWYGCVAWISSVLTRYGMPSEAYLVVAGFLTIVFALFAAKLFSKE